MKDFDNIEDWYREELNNYNVEPDGDVWNSLSDDLDANMTLTDENISEWYKREVSKLEERPDYTVWEKLATKLDTATVWDKLVVSLNRYEQMIWWRNTILKGSAILLLLFGSYEIYTTYFPANENSQLAIQDKGNGTAANLSKPAIAANEKVDSSTEGAKSTTNSLDQVNKRTFHVKSNRQPLETQEKSRTDKGSNLTLKTNGSKQLTALASEKKKTKSKMSRVDLLSIDEGTLLASTKPVPFLAIRNRREITEEDISHTFASSDFLVKKENNKIVFNSKRFSSHFTYGLYARRFYIGLNMGVKKQGLITQLNRSGALANANQVEYLDFGHHLGVTGGFILSDNINLESNLNVISTSGYDRQYSGEALDVREELDLNYTSINLLAKKMNTKSTFDNKVYSTNLIGGVYASYLNSSNAVINHNINKLDYGFVLGIEQDRYLSKTLVLTPGFRYSQGLANVFGNDDSFNYGYNFALEFNIGLKYIFLQKKSK